MDSYTINDIQARMLAGEGLSDQDTLQRGLEHLRTTAPNGDLCGLLVQAGRLDPSSAQRIRAQAGDELHRSGGGTANQTSQDDRPTQPLRRMGEDGRPLMPRPNLAAPSGLQPIPGSGPNLAAPSGLQPIPGPPPVDPGASSFATLPMPPPQSGRPSSSIANSHDSAEVRAPPGRRPPSSKAHPKPAIPNPDARDASLDSPAPKPLRGRSEVVERARRLSEEGKTEALPKIPGYELRSLLGRGGMGMVHVAWSVKLGREVALKTLSHIDEQHRANALKRFEREARTMASFTHPNIVAVLDFGIEARSPWLVMELIDGVPLKEKVRDGNPLEPDEAARITHRVARALDYAHKKDVLHRDVKSANILLRKDDGEALLTDFGLARRTDGAEKTMTGAGQVLGTPTYMSPEQVEGQRDEVTPRSDLYSLGVVLYECLTGTLPFHAASFTNLVMEILTADPKPPRELRPEIPVVLEEICLRCLEKNPEERFASCGELVEVLDQYLKHEAVTLPAPTYDSGVARVPAPETSARRTSPVLTIVVALVAAALAFAVGAHVGNKRDAAARVETATALRGALNEASEAWARERRTALRELDAEVAAAADPEARRSLRERSRVELDSLDPGRLRVRLKAAAETVIREDRDKDRDKDHEWESGPAESSISAAVEGLAKVRGELVAGHWRNIARLAPAVDELATAMEAARRSWQAAPKSRAASQATVAIASRLHELGHRRLSQAVLRRLHVDSLEIGERARAALLQARIDLQEDRFDQAHSRLKDLATPDSLADQADWLKAVAGGLAGRRAIDWPAGFRLTPAEDRGRLLFARVMKDGKTFEFRRLDLDAGATRPAIKSWKSPARIIDHAWLGRGAALRLAVTVASGQERRTLFLQLRDGEPVITERLVFQAPMDSTMVPRSIGDMDGDGYLDAVYSSNESRRCLIANGFGGPAPYLCLLTELCGSVVNGATFVDLDGTGRESVAIAITGWNHFGLGLVTRPKGSSEMVRRFKRLGAPSEPRRIPPVEGGKAERLLFAINRRRAENVGLLFGTDLSPNLPDSVAIVTGPAEAMTIDRVAEIPFKDFAGRGFYEPRYLYGLAKSHPDAFFVIEDGDPQGAWKLFPGRTGALRPVRIPHGGELVGLRDIDLDGDRELLRRRGSKLVIDGLAGVTRRVESAAPATELPGPAFVERLLADGLAVEAALLAEVLVREMPGDSAAALQRRIALLRASVRADLLADRPETAARRLAAARVSPPTTSTADGKGAASESGALLRTLGGAELAQLDREVCELVQDPVGALDAAYRERRSRPGPVRDEALSKRIDRLRDLAAAEPRVDFEGLLSGSVPFRITPLLRARRRDRELTLHADSRSAVFLEIPLEPGAFPSLSVEMAICVRSITSGGAFSIRLRDSNGASQGLTIGCGISGDETSYERGWFPYGEAPKEMPQTFGYTFPRDPIRLRLTWHDDLRMLAAEVQTKDHHGYEVFHNKRSLRGPLVLVISSRASETGAGPQPVCDSVVSIRDLKISAGPRGPRTLNKVRVSVRRRARAATAWITGRADGLRTVARESQKWAVYKPADRAAYWLAAAELAAQAADSKGAISCIKAAKKLGKTVFLATWRKHLVTFSPQLRAALAEVVFEGIPRTDLNNQLNLKPQSQETMPDVVLMAERIDPSFSSSNIPGIGMILLGRYEEGLKILSAFRDPATITYKGFGLSRLGRYKEALATWGPAEEIPKELRGIIEAQRVHAEIVVRERAARPD